MFKGRVSVLAALESVLLCSVVCWRWILLGPETVKYG